MSNNLYHYHTSGINILAQHMMVKRRNVNAKVFIVEKEHGCTDYESKRKIIIKPICDDGSY